MINVVHFHLQSNKFELFHIKLFYRASTTPINQTSVSKSQSVYNGIYTMQLSNAPSLR